MYYSIIYEHKYGWSDTNCNNGFRQPDRHKPQQVPIWDRRSSSRLWIIYSEYIGMLVTYDKMGYSDSKYLINFIMILYGSIFFQVYNLCFLFFIAYI